MLSNPFWGSAEFNRFAREIDRFNRDFDRSLGFSRRSSLETSWQVNENEVVVSAELPGYTADHLNIELTSGNRLTIAGKRDAADSDADAGSYIRRERNAASFSRSYKLPFAIDADGIEAAFANGILTVTLPRAEADKPRQIAVKAS